jgi:hypothetical protein
LLSNRVRLRKSLIAAKIPLRLVKQRLVVSQLPLGLIERGAIIAIIDARNHIARGDMLVVGDRHGGYVASDLGLDGKRACRNKGVVRRFKMQAVVPIEIARGHCWNEEKRPKGKRKRMPSQKTPARSICAFRLHASADRVSGNSCSNSSLRLSSAWRVIVQSPAHNRTILYCSYMLPRQVPSRISVRHCIVYLFA